MEIFTSPDFFAKLGKSIQPKATEAKPTVEEQQAEEKRLEDMSRGQFMSQIVSKASEAAAKAIKPELDKMSNQMATFISSQAEGKADRAVGDLIERIGRAEWDKYSAAMEAKAKSTRGNTMDDLYTLVSGKKAPKYNPNIIPNNTMKPDRGLKDLTEQKDLPLDEAGSRNFDHIFGKYKK